MSLEQNKDLVRRFVEEVQNRRDVAALDRFFSQDYVDHSGVAQPPDITGARLALERLFAAFPDQQWTIQRQIAEGDKVLTHKTLRGTHLGPFMGIPATGKSVTFEIMDIFTVADGKITEHWAVADLLGLLRQLGAA